MSALLFVFGLLAVACLICIFNGRALRNEPRMREGVTSRHLPPKRTTPPTSAVERRA